MMPQTTARVCHDCDGHATAHITTGTRAPDGTRTTLPVHCGTCHGTGTTAPRAVKAATR
ncbi:hypothetical protein [Streptomyces bohaiensis]|uniref:Molecular chaperone DnaJ n=1 Tax=Streptomyces bohaiensis TaxID=1431344 RepID=A0ABX1C9U0_9ACTN|nr:hypothetical protein [Streptomyces bohaiensis]NJQ14380.1 hypothetical protein [Streptomyces bohaiensis]